MWIYTHGLNWGLEREISICGNFNCLDIEGKQGKKNILKLLNKRVGQWQRFVEPLGNGFLFLIIRKRSVL